MNFVLDLEWTFSESSDVMKNTRGDILEREIIQIGCVKLTDDYKIDKSIKINVCPVASSRVTHKVEKLTGITYKYLKANGCKFKSAINSFKEFLNCEDITFFTWGEQDEQVLLENLKYWKLEKVFPQFNVIDIQTIIGKEYYPGQDRKSVEAVLEDFNLIPDGQFHDALDDATNEARIFEQLPDPENSLKNYDPNYFMGIFSNNLVVEAFTIEGFENIKVALDSDFMVKDIMDICKENVIPRFLHKKKHYKVWHETEETYLVEISQAIKQTDSLICCVKRIGNDEYEKIKKWYHKFCEKEAE